MAYVFCYALFCAVGKTFNMEKLIRSKLQGCENLAKVHWELIEEAVKNKDLQRLTDCVEELKKLHAKECSFELLLQDILRVGNKA